MIDIDKFITSLLQWGHLGIPKDAMCFALKEQGLEFRDGSISKVEPSIPEIVEEHFDEMLEDKSNPDNLHQYLYGSNEEEKIRKDIIWCLKHSGVKESNPINPHVTTIAKDAIAWLEKQGKQKDSVVDFKAKDWYVSKVDGKIYNAKFMEKTPTNQARRLEIEKAAMSATGIIEQEEWFIKGAEWSDKNPSYISSEKQGEQKPVIDMITPEESLGIDSETYSKIVDECVYGEQKPIKEHNACEFCEDRYGCVSPCSMKLIEEEKPTDKIESRQEELTEFEKAVKQVMEETIECGDTHNLKADADMLLRLVRKPAAWSEEDIMRIDNLIAIIENRGYPDYVEYLEKLKYRVQPQPMQEWSDKDEKMIHHIENAIKYDKSRTYLNSKGIEIIDVCNWLKSLRPQNRWKPSDEQMDALHYVTNFDYGGHKAILVSLYEQLKKLKG